MSTIHILHQHDQAQQQINPHPAFPEETHKPIKPDPDTPYEPIEPAEPDVQPDIIDDV
ncbi:hypothetical protein [Methylophilus sp. QUAN]|uniref:hypothetical protein n=1 Tax=Methylophilus sp. QUAN TaxID=2781020 RepID=UPI00188F3F97|nr:hypothetical protein [Methylophilus sp. QUAN]MBF4992303.1 hypothetical protein [Methylophilus sp. QUAN]